MVTATKEINTGRASLNHGSDHMRELWSMAAVKELNEPGAGTWVPVEAIVVKEELLPRDGADADVVRRYQDLLPLLPPILVQKDTFVLIDGLHRFDAAQATGLHVRVVEVDVPDDELWERALQANVGHGKPLTHEERLRGAKRLYRAHHPLTGGERAWSAGRIAEWSGVGRRTVEEWIAHDEQRRREAEERGEEIEPRATHRVDKSGQVKRVAASPQQAKAGVAESDRADRSPQFAEIPPSPTLSDRVIPDRPAAPTQQAEWADEDGYQAPPEPDPDGAPRWQRDGIRGAIGTINRIDDARAFALALTPEQWAEEIPGSEHIKAAIKRLQIIERVRWGE